MANTRLLIVAVTVRGRLLAIGRSIAYVFGGLAALALYGFAIWRAPEFLVNQDVLADAVPEQRLPAEHNSRLIVISIGGALVVGTGLLYTARNYRLAHRGQVTERFTKALERLGSEQLYVRIGGVHALEHVMRDSPDHHGDAVEVLVAFIRAQVPRRVVGCADEVQWMHPPTGTDSAALPVEPAADVQAALTALAKRPDRATRERNLINFRDLHLEGVQLQGALLARADLRDAQLRGANLRSAQLQGANLLMAQLQHADLEEAQLQGAYLVGVQLQGADLLMAQLQDADLEGAQLQNADLERAQLQGVNLLMAQLQGADLKGAQLQNANLVGAAVSASQLDAAHGYSQVDDIDEVDSASARGIVDPEDRGGPVIRIKLWKQIVFINPDGDVREIVRINAVAVRRKVYFLRFRAGDGQGDRYKRQQRRVKVNTRVISVNGNRRPRWEVTKSWLPDGRLNSLIQFHEPVRKGGKIDIEIERFWRGKCAALMREGAADSFIFRFIELMQSDAIEYNVVLPPGYDAHYSPIGFVEPDPSFSVAPGKDEEGCRIFAFRGRGMMPKTTAGMRLELITFANQ